MIGYWGLVILNINGRVFYQVIMQILDEMRWHQRWFVTRFVGQTKDNIFQNKWILKTSKKAWVL